MSINIVILGKDKQPVQRDDSESVVELQSVQSELYLSGSVLYSRCLGQQCSVIESTIRKLVDGNLNNI